MNNKSVTMSFRLSEEESDFIASQNIDGAKTPSDKLRGIIARAIQIEKGTKDYMEAFALLQNLSSDSQRRLLDKERKLNLRSELTTKITGWIIETFAYYLSYQETGKSDKDDLLEMENALSDRLFNLFESVLRFGITSSCPCYNPKTVADRMDIVLELTEIIKNKNLTGGETK